MEVLGIDVGFGFTKATNGKDFIIFKSLFGDATDIQFRLNIGSVSFTDNLHVTIGDQSFFIGDFAEQQSSVRQFTLYQERLLTEFAKILALTAAGSINEKYVPINVVSGLPIGYLKQYHQQFSKILIGHHEVIYHQADGSKVTRKININNVRMMPQPLGSIFNLLMDDEGKIVNKELAKQKVGVVDIGFRTTDFSIFDRLRYIERGSTTTDTGIAKSFGVISKKLREESGVSIEVFRLYKAVGAGVIKIRGKDYNFAKLRDQVFSNAAGIISNDIERLWADDWDIDTIVLTGGGSMELARYLKPLITGNVIPLDNKIDARLNNVQGYFKYGKYEWEKQSSETPPPAAEE
ncbi:MAG: ParM/StbA family protein [Desulfobacterales bacterium]|nr:MAG: ParM/StbA family protein [Desulfobacterales bacterium]UCD88904.1 MAG: ParM/StbA family protein [Desulfobacterales bacterium]